MVEYNAGDARLRIVPDASNFKKDLEAKLKTMQVNFTVKVDLQIAQAKADMARFRAEENNRALNQRVNPQFTNAKAELAAFRAEQRANAINIPVNIDTNSVRNSAKQAGAQASAEFQKEFEKGFEKVGGVIGKVFGGAVDIGKSLGIQGLVSSIPAAVTAVAALGQALGQLSGAALAVPGGIASAVASVGTLGVGLLGIKEAYTAVSAASAESTTGMAEKARAAASATQSLRNAVVDEAQAQKDVATARKDARQELQDLNLEMRGGQISIEQARNDALKARRDLAKGGFKDALDQRDAQLRVLEADQRVAEAISRQTQLVDKKSIADAKGVEGSDRVVAANERAIRSHQATASAQQALADATGTSLAAQDKMRDALAKLSPQAAEFVNTLVALKPKWVDLQKTVSGNLFEGASASFTQFVDKVLPNLKGGMSSIATAWNSNIKTLLNSLGNTNSKGLLDRILGNTADAQTRFSAAIDPLVRGIGTLTAAGSDAMPRLADAIGSIATRFANFIDTADKDGRLDKWINAGLTGFTNLGNILLNLGKSFFSINQALGGPGLLKSFSDLTARWAAFLGSTQGQNKLVSFFAEGKREIDTLKPIIQNIIDILPAIWLGVKDSFDTFMPVLREFTEILKSHPDLVRSVVSAFALWRTISPIVDGIKASVLLLNTALGASKAGGVAAAVAGGSGGGGMAALAAGGAGTTIGAFAAIALLGAAGTYVGIDALNNAVRTPAPPGYHFDNQDQLVSDAPPTYAPGDNGGLGDILGAPGGPPPAPGNEALKTAIDDWQTQNGVAPGAALTPDQQTRLNAYLHDKGIAGFESGGPTGAGLAVLHDDEFVLSARARKYPMAFKHALNEGRIDPKAIPHFKTGGPYPQDQGDILGPVGPAPSGGGAQAALGDLLNGLGSINTGGLFAPGGPLAGGTAPGAPAAPAPFTPGIAPLPSRPPVFGPPSPTPTPADSTGLFGPGGLLGGTSAPVLPGLPSPPKVPTAPTTGAPAAPAPAPSIPSPSAAVPTDPNAFAGTGALPGPPSDVPTNAPTPGLDPLALGPTNPFQQVWLNPDGSVPPIGQIIANLPDKLQPATIAKQLGQIALGFVSGFFGLDTTYLTAGAQAFDFFANKFGQPGTNSGDVYADPTGAVGALPGAGVPGATGLVNPATQASSLGGAKTTYTPSLLKSKGIAPLYTRTTDAKGNNVANIPAWAQQLAGAFHLTANSHVDSTLHGGAGASPDGGWAFDFSGKPEDEQRFADFIKTNLRGQTLQLIWQNPNTGEQDGIAGGDILGKNQYYTDPGGSYADHTDHVHWATDVQPNLIDPATGKSFLDAGPDALKALTAPVGASGGRGVGAPGDLKSRAYQAYIAAGMPPGEWGAFDQLISHESSWNPTNKNPSSTAYGLGQFLDTTWASVGGTKTPDPMTQLGYIFAYLKQRPDYKGSPATAWSLWNSRSPHWYDQGGILPPGLTLAHNKTGQNERVLNPAQNKAYEAMLPHFAEGGDVGRLRKLAAAVPPPPPRPLPRGPEAKPLQPKVPVPARPAPTPTAPTPAPAAPPPAPDQFAPPPQQPSGETTPAPGAVTGPAGENQAGSEGHLLPAVGKAIESGAATAGAIADTAVAAATFGASAALGGGGGGGGGGGISIGGIIQQGGKIVKGIAEVGASALVGNVTGGTIPGDAYGETYRPQQKLPQTAPLNGDSPGRNYIFNGIDSRNVVDEMRLKDAQDAQAVLARW